MILFELAGLLLGGVLSESLLLLLISLMEDFTRSMNDVMSLGGMCSLPSTSVFSILCLFTPATLILGCSYLRRLSFSLDLCPE